MKFLAEQYMADVKSGKQVTGELLQLAIERHDRDLKDLKGYYFDENKAKLVIESFALLKHYQGEWAGQPIILNPHQQFCYWLLFGWRRADGLRRFRTYYKEEARKNGKTSEAAAVGLYMLTMDNENAPQIYTVATKEEQARICFDTAGQFVKESPVHASKLGLTVKSIYDQKNAAFMRPLGSNSKKQDGFNPHCGIIDEYHEHPTDGMLNVIESGMGARSQPLIYIITTAGFNQSGPCYRLRKVAVNVLRGLKIDETFLPIICTLDDGDDWEDEKNWIKANPLLHEAVDIEFLRTRFEKAKNEGGTKEVDFKTKNLNIWTQSGETWVQDHKFMRNQHGLDPSELVGRECYGGLDLGHSVDLNAFTLLFPNIGEFEHTDKESGEITNRPIHGVKRWVWIPEAKIQEYKDDADWLNWQAMGIIEVTSGDFVDHEYITTKIDELARTYQIQSIAIDPYIARHYVIKVLDDMGMDFSELRQGFLSLSAPTKELERMLTAGELEFYQDPVFRWMVSNAIRMVDPANNIKLSKDTGVNKIDAVAALVNAVAEFMTPQESGSNVIEVW
jgi:phage terminase large subunit-like protein